MFQPDLFSGKSDDVAVAAAGGHRERVTGTPVNSKDVTQGQIDLPTVLERLALVSTRPRYTFMVLNLIARAAGEAASAGPYVIDEGREVTVRDWLSAALLPMAHRAKKRLAVIDEVRRGLQKRGVLPSNEADAEEIVAREVRERLLHSGRTNVSRAVSDLVRAGFVRRHYQGYRVDHLNRGAQREAVYTIIPAVKHALGHGL